jgi:hypothetical protein
MVANHHAGDIAIDDSLCHMLFIRRIECLALMFLVHLEIKVRWSFSHLDSSTCGLEGVSSVLERCNFADGWTSQG